MEANLIEQVGMKEKNKERVSKENENAVRNQIISQKSHQKNKHSRCSSVKILGTIFEVDWE